MHILLPRETALYHFKTNLGKIQRSAREEAEHRARMEAHRRDPWMAIRSAEYSKQCSELAVACVRGAAYFEQARAAATEALNKYMDRRIDEATGGVYFNECDCGDNW